MRTIQPLLFVAVLTAGGIASADRPPTGPDFQEPHVPRTDIDRDMAASEGDGPIQPVKIVLFGHDSAVLDEVDRVELRATARWAKAHPEARIVIEGHADPSGPDAYNRYLAGLRAQAVHRELLAAGVPAAQLEPVEFGEDWQVSDDAASNRRVRVWGHLPRERPQP